MARVLALLIVLVSVACGSSPTAPSGTPTTFQVVNGSGQGMAGIQVCPGDEACVSTDASGTATVILSREHQVRFLRDGVTLGGLMVVSPGSNHRVVLQ